MKSKQRFIQILILSILFLAPIMITYKVSASDLRVIKGCKNTPLEMEFSSSSIFIHNHTFTFKCDDNCKFNSQSYGIGTVITNGVLKYTRTFQLTFSTPGEHNISVYVNGTLNESLGAKIMIAENHIYGNMKVINQAACTRSGTGEYTCSVCETSYTTSIPATGHSYSKWFVIKKATLLDKGSKVRICAACRIKEGKSISRLKSNVALSKINLKLKRGNTYNLKIKKRMAGDEIKSWTSSKKNIVSVNRKTGKIKALKNGTAIITLEMKSGSKAKCRVYVGVKKSNYGNKNPNLPFIVN